MQALLDWHVAGGGAGNNDLVGGLVGNSTATGSTITASSATGDADGGNDLLDYVGGLVGYNAGSIIASYATGVANGGAEDVDHVGGSGGTDTRLVPLSPQAMLLAMQTGEPGSFDSVGGLVGNNGGTITESYGFGTAIGVENLGGNALVAPCPPSPV